MRGLNISLKGGMFSVHKGVTFSLGVMRARFKGASVEVLGGVQNFQALAHGGRGGDGLRLY